MAPGRVVDVDQHFLLVAVKVDVRCGHRVSFNERERERESEQKERGQIEEAFREGGRKRECEHFFTAHREGRLKKRSHFMIPSATLRPLPGTQKARDPEPQNPRDPRTDSMPTDEEEMRLVHHAVHCQWLKKQQEELDTVIEEKLAEIAVKTGDESSPERVGQFDDTEKAQRKRKRDARALFLAQGGPPLCRRHTVATSQTTYTVYNPALATHTQVDFRGE